MDRTDLFNKIYEKTNLNHRSLNYLKKDLIERGEFLSSQIENVRKWHKERNTDPIDCPEIGILTNEIIENDIQISIIEDELSRLQLENSKSSPNGGGNKKSGENRILAYNNEVDNALEKIELILNDINSLLFENSTSDQWEQILNLETPTNPIICKSNIDINCLTAFCEKLCNVGIFRTQYKSFLASITAFTGDKLIPITKGRQFTDALQYGNEKGTTIDKELEEIFNKFKEKI